MQIDKAQLLQLLRYKGRHDQPHEAQQELPDQVDIDKHANQRSSSVSARPIYSGNSSAVWTASSPSSSPSSTNIDNNGSRIAKPDSRAAARASGAAVPPPQEG